MLATYIAQSRGTFDFIVYPFLTTLSDHTTRRRGAERGRKYGADAFINGQLCILAQVMRLEERGSCM